MLITCPQGIIT